MLKYSFVQLVFFFLVYCFMGWIIESTWVSLHQKKFVNRGFMRGPFIPIYGSGAMMLLVSSAPFIKWPPLVFLSGMIACSALEYFTGVMMLKIFKVRYWDYSYRRFNLNGHICLFISICWGFLSLAENYFLHRPIEKMCMAIPEKVLNSIVCVISVYFIADLTLAFKAAFDLRDLIIYMEKVRNEVRLMEKRLDVILAFAEDDIEKRADSIEARIQFIKERLDKIDLIPDPIEDKVRDEIAEIKTRLNLIKQNRPERKFFREFYKRDLFRGNPELTSDKFKDAFNDIKEAFEKRIWK